MADDKCDSSLFFGKEPTDEQLKIIIDNHKKWLIENYDKKRPNYNSPLRANFCGAILKNKDPEYFTKKNLALADLRKTDLSCMKLEETDLHGANLNGAKLSNVQLIKVKLHGASLDSVNLSYATLIQTNLSNTRLSEVNLKNATILGSNLSKSNLTASNLSNTKLYDVDFTNASIRDSNLINADFTGSILTDTLFHYSNFTKNLEPKIDCDKGSKFIGKEPTNEELEIVIKNHQIWLTNNRDKDKKWPDYDSLDKANLCGAILKNKKLGKKDLAFADLRKTDLSFIKLNQTDLHKAWLDGANLSCSTLDKVNLSNAYLLKTDLSNAKITESNLKKASLKSSILTGINIHYSDLSDVNLAHSDLSSAELAYVNFTNASIQKSKLIEAKIFESTLTDTLFNESDFTGMIYFPKHGTHPNIAGIAVSSETFKKIILYDKDLTFSPGVFELREAYQKAGMRDKERLITNMLKTKEREVNWDTGDTWDKINAVVSYIFFELPSGYGLYPTRPLTMIIVLYFVFAAIYWVGLSFDTKRPFLEIRWTPKYPTAISHGNSDICVRLCSKGRLRRYTKNTPFNTPFSCQYNTLLLARIAFYLSLMSAFKVGWRDFQISNWISLLQSHDYKYVTRGWLRQVSGLQSLLSFYLLVLWLLTQFGRPFN